ncbi:MAG: hypothetical protein ABSB26_06745 [Nitrososphaerales archaeon]
MVTPKNDQRRGRPSKIAERSWKNANRLVRIWAQSSMEKATFTQLANLAFSSGLASHNEQVSRLIHLLKDKGMMLEVVTSSSRKRYELAEDAMTIRKELAYLDKGVKGIELMKQRIRDQEVEKRVPTLLATLFAVSMGMTISVTAMAGAREKWGGLVEEIFSSYLDHWVDLLKFSRKIDPKRTEEAITKFIKAARTLSEPSNYWGPYTLDNFLGTLPTLDSMANAP